MTFPSGCAAALRGAAFAFALMFLTASQGAVTAKAQSSISTTPAQHYEGVVTDTHCGAKHSASIGDTAGDCTIRCVRAGEQFALVVGESTYLLEGDPAILKQAAGQRVKVFGTLNDGRISVTSITTL